MVITGGAMRGVRWAPAAIVNVNDKRFIPMVRCDRALARFCGLPLTQRSPWDGNVWPDFLGHLRNTAVREYLEAKAKGDDPLGEAQCSTSTRPKRQQLDIDEIDITIPVVGGLAAHSMKVVAEDNFKKAVAFELKEENLDYLAAAVHLTPPFEMQGGRRQQSQTFAECPNVRWCPHTRKLSCGIMIEGGAKRRIVRRLPECSDVDMSMQFAMTIAKEMQSQFDAQDCRRKAATQDEEAASQDDGAAT